MGGKPFFVSREARQWIRSGTKAEKYSEKSVRPEALHHPQCPGLWSRRTPTGYQTLNEAGSPVFPLKSLCEFSVDCANVFLHVRLRAVCLFWPMLCAHATIHGGGRRSGVRWRQPLNKVTGLFCSLPTFNTWDEGGRAELLSKWEILQTHKVDVEQQPTTGRITEHLTLKITQVFVAILGPQPSIQHSTAHKRLLS